MAFLVCYSKTVEDHTNEQATYLDQNFYEKLFNECSSIENRYAILGKIANLKYKSPTMSIDEGDLQIALDELDQLPDRLQQHKSTHAFRNALEEAIDRKCIVTISADMYREVQS